MYHNDPLIRRQDLVDNPSPRVPVCLCLDISGSMYGQPIEELNKGVSLFYGSIRADEVASYATDLCIVTFGGKQPVLAVDFVPIYHHQINPPSFNADGYTPMGEAVNMALDCLEIRKQEYKDTGVDYYQPWLVLMTDGLPEGGSQSEMDRAVTRTVDLVNHKKLTVFPIYINSSTLFSADQNESAKRILQLFSPKRPVLTLRGLNFSAFFDWLSRSVSKVSVSMPGEEVNLDPTRGWSTL